MLIELVIVIVVVVVLVGIALDRFRFYQEMAEKVAMEGVANALQSALFMQYAHLLAQGKAGDLPVLVRDNPMNWLQRRPVNYAGEFLDPASASVEPGNWVFDMKSRELVYIVRNRDHFKPGSDGQPWIRFHVDTRYQASQPPLLHAVRQEPAGELLVTVQPYSWF